MDDGSWKCQLETKNNKPLTTNYKNGKKTSMEKELYFGLVNQRHLYSYFLSTNGNLQLIWNI